MSIGDMRPATVVLVLLLLSSVLVNSPAAASRACFGRTATISGTDQGETLQGTSGPDVIFGGGGDDIIHGGGGEDRICGGGSSDAVFGERAGDMIDGGPGDDYLSGSRGDDAMIGGGGSQGNFGDVFDGGPGADAMTGTQLGDSFTPGPGRDTVRGGGSRAGSDSVRYWDSSAAVEVDLRTGVARGEGRDRLLDIEDIIGSSHPDMLKGSGERNVIVPGKGADVVKGREHSDIILDWGQAYGVTTSGRGDDRLFGGAGADDISAACGSDLVRAGEGSDRIRRVGGRISADEVVECSYGRDAFFGGANRDVLWIQEGPVSASLAEGKGFVRGTLAPGSFTIGMIENLHGSRQNNMLIGDHARNRLTGGLKGDVIRGGRGGDRIVGLAGDDQLNGEGGADVLFGGPGRDTCKSAATSSGCEK